MTYSIVARDPDTGHLGVAAQSYYFALGSVLPWARAGVGAVATQSLIHPGYGPRTLDLLADGVSVTDALAQVRANDSEHEERQVGVVDATGATAAFTGANCIPCTSHAEGLGYATQANLMARHGVCEAMAAAYEASTGPLADRLLAALVAAEAAGGDARGQMSATLMVVDHDRSDHPWEGVLIDVRVDHHPAPLDELARLIRVAQAQAKDETAWEQMSADDHVAALATIDAGLALTPDDPSLLSSRVCALVGLGRLDEARDIVAAMTAQGPLFADLLRMFAEHGLLTFVDRDSLERVLRPPAV